MNRIIELAHEIQALASDGLTYSRNEFDIERYTRMREIAAELTAEVSDEPPEKISRLFSENDGYQTPKVSTRAAIFNDRDEVLLVHDYDGKWVMPGGWCEYNLSLMENTVKEAWEEAGLNVRPLCLVAMHHHQKRFHAQSFFHVLDTFILCEAMDGEFHQNSETSERRYFALDRLPELNTHKTDREIIEVCLKARKAEHWVPLID